MANVLPGELRARGPLEPRRHRWRRGLTLDVAIQTGPRASKWDVPLSDKGAHYSGYVLLWHISGKKGRVGWQWGCPGGSTKQSEWGCAVLSGGRLVASTRTAQWGWGFRSNWKSTVAPLTKDFQP